MAGGNLGGVQTSAKLKGDILSYPPTSAAELYRGGPVAVDTSTGLTLMGSDLTGQAFVGMAEESLTAVQSAVTGAKIKVRRHGIFRMTCAAATTAAASLGQLVYLGVKHTSSADPTVVLNATSTYKNIVGMIVGWVSSGIVWVDIMPVIAGSANSTDLAVHVALATQTAHKSSAIIPQVGTDATATPVMSAAEFFGGIFTCSSNGTLTWTLPATGILAGTVCRIVKTGTVGIMTITATAIIGPQCTGNKFYGCQTPGDSVDIMCMGNDSFVVVGVHQKVRPAIAKDGAVGLTAAETVQNPVVTGTNGSAVTVAAADATNAGSDVIVTPGAAASMTVICAAGFGGAGATRDTITVLLGESAHLICDGASWHELNRTISA